jgi:hypothetical protein
MDAEPRAKRRENLEELFKEADQTKLVMQKTEELLQQKWFRYEERTGKILQLEAEGASQGKIQLHKELRRKVYVGIGISVDYVRRLHRKQSGCLSNIRDLLLGEQQKLRTLKEKTNNLLRYQIEETETPAPIKTRKEIFEEADSMIEKIKTGAARLRRYTQQRNR